MHAKSVSAGGMSPHRFHAKKKENITAHFTELGSMTVEYQQCADVSQLQ